MSDLNDPGDEEEESVDGEPSHHRSPRRGEFIGRYALLDLIGQGSSGVVFEAHDLRLGRSVAIKVLHPHNAGKPELEAHFYQEAMVAASAGHPNVVVIHDHTQTRDGLRYMVLELLVGETLRRRIHDRGRLSVKEALEIIVPIMGALVILHRLHLVHRDLKPENIYLAQVSGREVPKLIDFGVAKDIAPDARFFTTKRSIGTPSYMAPEQIADGIPVDERADVWAIGTILFELVAGTRPFGQLEQNDMLIALQALERPPLLTTYVGDAPPQLTALLRKALEPRIQDRFPTMGAFLSSVLDFADSLDPTFALRHRASIPPDVHGDHVIVPPPNEASSSLRERPISSARSVGSFVPVNELHTEPPDLLAIAEQELKKNALERAIEHAEQAARGRPGPPGQLGRLRLIQAIACVWLGRFTEAERWARVALSELQRGSNDWYLALGHLATACGNVGKSDDLRGMVTDLDQQAAAGDRGASYVTAASQIIPPLVRAGMLDDARRLVQRIEGMLEAISSPRAAPVAWRDLAQAELALHQGDVITSLQRSEAAAKGFLEAGDARYACLQYANIGNAHMLLGSYARAEAQLRESLRVGEPMKLGRVVEVARSNLSFTLARLGRLPEAREMANAAITGCIAQCYPRGEAYSRLCLAEIHQLAGDLPSAEAEVARAIAKAKRTPAVRAHAKALLANLYLAKGQLPPALKVADDAMSILRALGGIEQGESFIRLADIRALRANGYHELAQQRVVEARRRLLKQAERLTDPVWRQSFLENVPENAELYRLGE